VTSSTAGSFFSRRPNTEAEVTDLIKSGINLSSTIRAGDGITSSDAAFNSTHAIGVGTVQNDLSGDRSDVSGLADRHRISSLRATCWITAGYVIVLPGAIKKVFK
jgi:hypothetical protein